MKKILFLVLLVPSAFAQVEPLEPGSLITTQKIIGNFNTLKQRMMSEKYFADFSYSLPSGKIKKEDLTNIITMFESKLGGSLNTSLSSSVKASELNEIFSKIDTAINQYKYLSCKDLLSKQSHLLNQDGVYNIHPQGIELSAYCDMTSLGGGWTRLNSTLATSTRAFSANGYNIAHNNVAVNCSVYSVGVRVSNVKITDWSLVRDDFYRSTITQCPALNYQQNGSLGPGASYYKHTDNNYYPVSTCAWAYQNGPSPWDTNSHTSMVAGEAYNIRLVADFLQPRANIEFTSSCSDSSDTGMVTHTLFVK